MTKFTDTTQARTMREQRAQTLAGIANREDLIAVLRDPPAAIEGCKVYAVLLACPGIGKTKLQDICMGANVWPFTLMRELTPHKTVALIYRLMH